MNPGGKMEQKYSEICLIKVSCKNVSNSIFEESEKNNWNQLPSLCIKQIVTSAL